MKFNFNKINLNLNKKGYFVVKDFLKNSDIDKSFLTHLKKKEKFVDGVIHGIDDKYYNKINKKIKEIAKKLHNKNLNISDDKFCYACIRINKQKKKTQY